MADIKTVISNKRRIKDVKSTVIKWVATVSDDIDAMWEIPVAKANTDLGFNVSVEYLKTVLGISKCAAQKYRALAYPLIKVMIENEILVSPNDISGAATVESRRKLLSWYRKLNSKEKSQLPIFGNKISLGKIPTDQRPIKQGELGFDVVKKAWESIHQDLENLGLLDTNYKSVSQRIEDRNSNPKPLHQTKKDKLNRLANLKLNDLLDFIEPSEAEPFIQIEQLFASMTNSLASESGKDNYRNACSLFIKFLSGLHGNTPLKILENFDEHLLSKYRKHLENNILDNKISSHHANTVLSSVRVTLDRLTKIKGLEYVFFDVAGFDTTRQTDLKKPFSKNERIQILEAIDQELNEAKLSLEPYKKTGMGSNPLDQNGNRVRGLSTLENARWLFENMLNCKPIHFSTAKTPIEQSFLRIIADSKKGLMTVYKEWGVTPIIGVELLLPYFLKLAQVTGLNTDSIIALNIDDYEPCHPATSCPCLKYWKERSDGYKEYPLDLIDADISWLTVKQAQTVKAIFDDVIRLTRDIRKNIDDEKNQQRLFIYQSNSVKHHGRITPLLGNEDKNSKKLTDVISKFVKKYNLTNDKDCPLVLTISRFRPTLISEMLDSEASLREIQLLLGHKSIRTTIQYLDSLDFNALSRKKLNEKLIEIQQSTLDTQSEEKQKRIELKKEDHVTITFKTPLAECKNIFAPPEFIKNLSSYTHGTPCSQYNKCLSCDNVIVSVKDLPQIFAMQRDYKLLIENSQVMNTPYARVIEENLELIKHIIDPKLSDFSIEELKNAEITAEYIEATFLVDGVL
ncbi:hypothetical protein GCM10023206_28590 [Acinetobacter puyangensis]|uniref:Phage integrase family protein n=1 Tax=Acinetobacter puyangensis TaxID=1096779 RepID=A0A240E456_9GAMM|nr:tyrosine-type recombinase/integrase [Acinetobacter puyangensis]SNX43372.1 Phage integrase family protein [Acinetobacter puyangensis]